jgi:hypothetical protein
MNSKPKEKAMTTHKKTEHYHPDYVQPEREPGHTQAAVAAGRAESEVKKPEPVKAPPPPPVSPVKIVSERDKVIEEVAKVAETKYSDSKISAENVRALKDSR